MIISRTPLRVSFIGGGTDLPAFCNRERGAVISTTIKKYVYIVVHPSFDKKNIIQYKLREEVGHVDEIKNTRVKEAMKMTGVTSGVEIHSLAEVPSGTGLGSSSSFTVGLLNALYAYQGKHVSAEKLAREACEIEINSLKEPIGRQDQYAAAFGGFNKIEFVGGDVKIRPLIFKQEIKKQLQDNLLLFHLGKQEDASIILNEQNKNIVDDFSIFNKHKEMRDLADEIEKELIENNISFFGRALHQNWLLKRQLASGISSQFINECYEKALKAGAMGGKVLGAGGRGFILIYAKPQDHDKVRNALDLREMDLNFDIEGSRIIYSTE